MGCSSNNKGGQKAAFAPNNLNLLSLCPSESSSLRDLGTDTISGTDPISEKKLEFSLDPGVLEA